MKSLVSMFGFIFCCCLSACSAFAEVMYDWTTSGSYSVGKSTTVTIPEDGNVYLTLSGLKPGGEYTFVANGEGAGVEVVYTYSDDGDVWDGSLASSSPDVKTENQERCIVYYDDWVMSDIVRSEDYDSEEWNEFKVTPKGYYLCVSGEGGASVTLTSVSGAHEESIPVGDMENPKAIVPGSLPSTYSSSFVEAAYYFTVKSAKVGKYLLTTTKGTEEDPITLEFDSSSATMTYEDISSTVAEKGNVAYLVDVTAAGELNFHVTGTGASFGLTHQYASAGTLGKLTVNTKGANGKWYIKGVTSTKYESGTTIGILGSQTVVFESMKDFTTPENQIATPTESEPEVVLTGVYNDKYDPKDNSASGATKLSISAKKGTAPRTLFGTADPADHFSFSAKDGVFYNFELEDLVGDAEMAVYAKSDETKALAGPGVKIAKFAPGAGEYIVKVSHDDDNDAQYTLAYASANVGAISFAKTAVSVKKSVGTVALSVNRSSGEGKVRVLYGTVNGTAKPGVDYYAQQGELVWENGDKKAKTITIRLIPEAFAAEALSRQFTVQLKAVDDEEIADDEYKAAFAAGKDVAVVTVTEAKAKAAAAVKPATTKTEVVPLESGTYQGVVAEEGGTLTNGFPALASITFTAKDVTKMKTVSKALSAKVVLAGKTYTFAADAWDPTLEGDGGVGAILTQVQKVGKVAYTNTLMVTLAAGATEKSGDWLKAGAQVVLTMNVPDANNKGVQEGIVYSGELFRDNAKVQDYLYAVTNAVGYYTVALVPWGISVADGIPAGNGYITLTIDNKGKAKIAGVLADGSTKPSASSIVAVRDDGDTLFVPVFMAKSPCCFGGTLKLVRDEDGRYVVDTSVPLLWNNDNAALTYEGEEGWSIELDPVGGYFNTVDNLQAHYLTHDFSVGTVGADELLEEGLASGYRYVTSAQPNELPVALTSNTFSTDKKTIIKDGKLVDFENSVNPCNVQVKLTRATGLVTGSFSIWTENEDGTAQKEMTGFKHYGIMLLSRDGKSSSIDSDILVAGFFNQAVTIKYTVTDAKGKEQNKTRKYTASMPFNILAVDQGEPDWYADDWGERPEE